MAVLVEAFNIIAKSSVIESKYLGGVTGYAANCPTATFCQDDHLCRVGFGNAEEAEEWGNSLLSAGLDDEVNGVLQDIAFADSSKGLAAPCGWLEFSRDENGTLWTWLHGTEMGERIAHEGWEPGHFYWIDSNHLAGGVLVSDKKWWQFWR
jgi:hypothetical protein